MRKNVLFLFAALGCAATPALAADAWVATTRLSGLGYASSSSAAIDANGDAVVVWTQNSLCGGNTGCDFLTSRSRAPGKAWGALQTVSIVDPALHIALPALRMSEVGVATAFWTDDNGLKTADKALKSPWTKPFLLAPGIKDYTVTENRKGDAALLIGNDVLARYAGSSWHSVGSPIPASVPRAQDDDVVISVTGDIVVSWESYDLVHMGRRFVRTNFVLHAARLSSGTSNWRDSGVLAGPDRYSHRGLLAIDDHARAGLISSVDLNYTVRTQAPGQAWAAPVALPTTNYIAGFASDAAGDATALATEGANNQVVALAGSLGGGAWTRQAVLSCNDRVTTYLALAVSPSGSAAVLWGYGDPNASPVTITAATRPSAFAPWRPQRDLSLTQAGSPESVAAAGVDHAAASWQDYDSSFTNSRVTASVHQP